PLDAVKEALDELPLGRLQISQAPDSEPVAAAQYAGNRHHPMLLEGQEVSPRILPPQSEHRLGDLRIRQPVESVQTPPQRHVRNGLDVKHQSVHELLKVQRRIDCKSSFREPEKQDVFPAASMDGFTAFPE